MGAVCGGRGGLVRAKPMCSNEGRFARALALGTAEGGTAEGGSAAVPHLEEL